MGHTQSLVDLSGLQWIRGELDQNLERVHQFIEAYLEAPHDKLPLQRSVVELHQARGILAMVRLHGAALLTEELRLAVHDVLHGGADENVEEVFEVMLGGAVQLSDYLDYIQTESTDTALIFHPLINELRVARGKPVVNESELCVRYLVLEPPEVEIPSLAGRDTEAAVKEAKAFQSHFDVALLGVLRDQDANTNFLRLTQIVQQLLKTISEPELYKQWLYAEAVLEALVDRGLEAGLDIKKLLGKLGMLLKYLAKEGESSPNALDKEVAYALLYYVGRATTRGAKVQAVRVACELDDLLPDEERLEEIRDRLRGPNTGLLHSLSQEIRKDLGMVKDNLDLLLRAGDKAPDRLDETVSTIRRVATTLDMLGMTALQRVVSRQAEVVDRRRHESQPDQREWLEAAVSLLWVEHSLDELLFRHVHPYVSDDKAPPEEPDNESISPLELREGAASILREALVNVARVKELSNVLLNTHDAEHVEEMSHLLHEMSAGLSVIGVDHTDVQTVERLRDFVQQPAFRFIGKEADKLSHYADAMSSLELYLLALQGKQTNSAELLQKCNDYVAGLELPSVSEEELKEDAAALEPEVTEVAVPVAAEAVDPEIREIFLEEVGEIREMLSEKVPAWSRHTDDIKVLGDIRRAFHTLKGSGRMAGATAIGDYGWAVEQVLNSCLDGSLPTDHAVVKLVNDANDNLSSLITAFENASTLPAESRQVILDAHRITSTEPPATVVATAEAQSDEDDLWSIFSKDAEQHLKNLREFLAVSGDEHKPQLVTAELVRAFHTLKSGSRLVGISPLSRMSGEFEALADAVRATGRPMHTDSIALIARATTAIEAVMAARGDVSATDIDLDELAKQAHKMISDVPTDAAATDRELIVIFTDEACDVLDSIEAAIGDWKTSPADSRHPAAIIDGCEQLAESADTAKITAMVMVAQEMARLVKDWQNSQVTSGHIEPLHQVVAGLYDILDRLRQGIQVEQAGDLLSQLHQLAEMDAPLSESEAAKASASETPGSTEPAPSYSPEASLRAEAVAEFQTPPEPLIPPSVTDAAVPPSSDHMDDELFSLFVEEGEEILDAIGHEIDHWESQPENKDSMLELMRLLHTLKGSARMAGATHIGDLSHRLEDELAEMARDNQSADAVFFGRLRNVSDAIHDELSGYRQGKPKADVPVAAAAEVESSSAEPEILLDIPGTGIPETPAAEPELHIETGSVSEEAEASDELLTLELPDDALGESPEEADVAPVDQAPADEISIEDLNLELENISEGVESMLAQLGGQTETADAKPVEPEPQITEEAAAEEIPPGPEPEIKPVDPAPQVITQPAMEVSQLEPKPEPEIPQVEEPEPEAPQPAARRAEAARAAGGDSARVAVSQLDQMFNEAGEVGIYLGRMEKQQADLRAHLGEMSSAIAQMRERIRQLDIETENQMQAGGHKAGSSEVGDRYSENFDPLEMDRYTRMNELSRSLNESAADLVSLQSLMEEVNSSNETLLLQQGRITSNLQHGLMNTMVVPFSGVVQRLQRTVRQSCQSYDKQARIEFVGADNELDRNVLERMAGPLEHLLRNAVVHGIEKPDDRQKTGKKREGRIRVSLRRDGTQSIIEISDDGRGLDLAAIRNTAVEKRLIQPGAELSDLELVQMIFEPGFSTASKLTHEAGRGVGMDIVNAEIKQLGGNLSVSFNAGQGTDFLIRIPSSLALTQALLVRVGQESYAIGMAGIDGIERLPRSELPRYLAGDGPKVLYGGESYRAIRLSDLVNTTIHDSDDEDSKNIPVLLLRAGDENLALVVDQVIGSDELIVKSLGPQVSAIPGVSGGTILADGDVVLIVDVPTLYQTRHRRVMAVTAPAEQAAPVKDERPLIMIVDDSITIRRVTERFLSRHGYRIETAKDGMDALPKLQAERPDVVLLDVEMPRIDGFEVATYMRNNEDLNDVPIIMITSRSGEKHRKRAADIGVNRYLIKPYQEDDLLNNLEAVLGPAD